MATERLYSPKKIKEVLDLFGFSFSKALGQNFLIDGNILRKIVARANISKEDFVLEIGPGFGTLTEELCLQGGRVLAVEKDQRLESVLDYTLQEYDNVEILFGDVLDLNLREVLSKRRGESSVKVIANLPYYVTTPILSRLLEEQLPIDSITVMVQKEVAERMVAQPSTKEYGSLSVFIRYYSRPSLVVKVPGSVFMPRPKVDSAVVHLEMKKNLPQGNREIFFDLVHSGFQQRRKSILNSLSSEKYPREKIRKALEASGLSENLRAENLSEEDFLRIAEQIEMIESPE